MFTAVFTGYICLLWIVLGKGAQNSKQWPNDQRFFEGGGGGGIKDFRMFFGEPHFPLWIACGQSFVGFFFVIKMRKTTKLGQTLQISY